jgi:transcriptional regulator with AAA-type ATPase domain
LKRRLSIVSALIFDSSVDDGTPTRTAAPNGPDTSKLLQSYDWPGNIRELQNVIEREIWSSSSWRTMFSLCRRGFRAWISA